MPTPAQQAELFLKRAVELERRAVGNREGSLGDTLLTLAAYYRELSDQASQHQRTVSEPAAT
jgi:hypothetical protein